MNKAENKEGMAKNFEVVQKEIAAYRVVLSTQWERALLEPKWSRKAHVIFGLLPDAHRVLPRTLSYLAILSLPLIAVILWL